MEFTSYVRCACGAITLFADGVKEYGDTLNRSVSSEYLSKFLPNVDLTHLKKLPDTYQCNHCVNHYGLDLCACGSGEYYWECDGDFEECGHPMQTVERGQYPDKCLFKFESPHKIDSPSASHDSMKKGTEGLSALLSKQDSGPSVEDSLSALREKIFKAKEAEAKARTLASSLLDEIYTEVRDTPVDGVMPLPGPANCFVVNLSTIMNSPNMVMAAEYYSATSQADLVHTALSAQLGKGLTAFFQKLEELAEEGYVTVQKTRYPLNGVTLQILRRAVAAQY